MSEWALKCWSSARALLVSTKGRRQNHVGLALRRACWRYTFVAMAAVVILYRRALVARKPPLKCGGCLWR